MINKKKLQFFAGLTPDEAAIEFQTLSLKILSHHAPVTILPNPDEIPFDPIWTQDALTAQKDQFQDRFPDDKVDLVVLPNRNTQRLAVSELTDIIESQKNNVSQKLFEPTEHPTQNIARPSLSIGTELNPPDEFPTTINIALERAANGTRELISIAKNTNRISYSDLLHQALSILGGLQKAGIKRREIILVDMRDAPLGIAGLFACMLGDFIPTPLILPEVVDSEIQRDRLAGAVDLLHPAAILTARPLVDLNFSLPKVLFLTKLSNYPVGVSCGDINPSQTALIILTSGSTGSAKGVHQSHTSLLEMVWGYLICGHGVGPKDLMMNWMPLDHVGSLAFALIASITAGISFVQVETALIMGSPERWVEIASEWKATITWFPNFAFRLLAEHAPSSGSLESLRRIVSGGEAVQAEDTALFIERLAPLGLKTTGVIAPSFGMSETCSGLCFSLNELEIGTYACLGRPTPNSAIRIVDENLNILPEGKIGHFQVGGKQLLLRYHGEVDSPFTTDGWFQTGDLGFIVDGALYLTGRAKDVLNINGQKYFPQDIENAARSTPGVDPACLVALPHKGAGTASESLVILFAPKLPASEADDLVIKTLSEGIRAAVRDKINLPVQHCLPFASEDIPRTSIGKINRTTMTSMLLAGELDPIIRRMSRLEGLSPTISVGLHRVVSCSVANSLPRLETILRIQLNSDGRVKVISNPRLGIPPNLISGLISRYSATSQTPYSLILSIAKIILELAPTEIPDRIQFMIQDFSEEAAAPLIGLIRSLRLTQQQNWQVITCSSKEDCNLDMLPQSSFARLLNKTSETDKLQRLVDLPPQSAHQDGFWIIFGGLGGIGRNIAKKLDMEGLSIICIGRTPEVDLTLQQREYLQRLSHGAYYEGDLCEIETLPVVVTFGKSLFSKPLAGIILAAGSGYPIHLDQETEEIYGSISAPLLAGIDAALKITTDHPGASVTIVGSVVGFLGGRVHGYAAAHAALFAAARKAIQEGYPLSYIGFSAWAETGLSLGTTSEALLARDGLQFICAETGALLVDAVRRRPGMLCFAGIDDMHPAIAPLVNEKSQPLVRVAAAMKTLSYPGAIEAIDALGRRVLIAARPLIASDQQLNPDVLWERSLALHPSDLQPEGPIERMVAYQFRIILGLEKISRDDDFFGRGGTSITAARLANTLSRLFFIDVSISFIFQSPTPRKLATDLVAREIEPGITEAVAEQIELILSETPTEINKS